MGDTQGHAGIGLDDAFEGDVLVRAFSPHILARDWSLTPLGPIRTWPRALKLHVAQMCNSPMSVTLRWGPSAVQIFNTVTWNLIGDQAEERLGACLQELDPEGWARLAPYHIAALRGSSTVRNNQKFSFQRDGRTVDTWMDTWYAPLLDDDGVICGVSVTATESTESVRRRLAADAARAESARMRALLEHAPGYIAVVRGPNHVFDIVNTRLRELTGGRPLVGRPVAEALPEIVAVGFVDRLDRVFATGRRVIEPRVEVPRGPGPMGQRLPRYVDYVYEPTRGPDGEVNGVFFMGTDVTGHVQAIERQELLVNELNHRVKNTLAVVLSIARLSGKSAQHTVQFVRDFVHRVEALANTHGLLTQSGWTSVSVSDLIALEQAPYAASTSAVTLNCSASALGASQAVKLSLIVHELFANAARHGALSDPDGRVNVQWRLEDETAVLDWAESGVDTPVAIESTGFGSLLIERLVLDLGGCLERLTGPRGWRLILRFPSAALGLSAGDKAGIAA